MTNKKNFIVVEEDLIKNLLVTIENLYSSIRSLKLQIEQLNKELKK